MVAGVFVLCGCLGEESSGARGAPATTPPSKSASRLHQRRGTELAERVVPEHDRGRRVQPRGADHRRGDRLVERRPARGRVGPDVRHAVQVEDLAESAVLAGDAVQDGEHRVRGIVAQPIDQ
jgi:hypothetical protein